MLHAIYGSIWEISQIHFFLNILTFRGLFQAIRFNKPSKIYIFTLFKVKVFWWNEAVEVIEITEFVEADEAIEAI